MNPTVSVTSADVWSPRFTSRVSGSSVANSRSSTNTSDADASARMIDDFPAFV